MRLFQEASEMMDQIRAIRRDLHMHPELRMDLPETIGIVKKNLQSWGIPFEDCGGGVSVSFGPKDCPAVLLRADMDALPIQEETGLEYASLYPGRMHACGHDMHTASLLGAAYLINKHSEELRQGVKLMFQPSEEALEGARSMVAAGILENPPVKAAVMMHCEPKRKDADAFVAKGVSHMACDQYHVVVTGKGIHGATPEKGRDPIVCAAHLILALQNIEAREIAAKQSVVQTFGMISGGSAPNIIPETVELKGTLRTVDEQVRVYVKKRMEEICAGVGQTFDCKCEILWTDGVAAVDSNPKLGDSVAKALSGLDGVRVSHIEVTPGGSEDFSYVSTKVPGQFIGLCCAGHDDGTNAWPHTPDMYVDEDFLAHGMAIYAQIAFSDI